MFNLFKKKNNFKILAIGDGKTIDITTVNDPTFAQKLMGDGIAMELDNGTIVAPCDGTLSVLPQSKHAFGLKCDNGLEILVHIGIDTVTLNGECFTTHKNQGDSVKAGEPVITVDIDGVKAKGIDTTTMVILLNGSEFEIANKNIGQAVKAGTDSIIEIK